jgi:creatinine amidohydrolase/Fe(II)-dependent formamide hydrolase-like protein
MYINEPAPALHTQSRRIVILPIGSCEQHGPYLPVDTDLRIAQLLAEQVVQSFSHKDTLLLPALPYSCSWEHKGLGTLALNTATLSSVLHDIAYSLKAWDIPTLLVLINWHGGNSVLGSLATEITATEDIPTATIQAISQAGKIWSNTYNSSEHEVHAGAIETSIIQAYWPDLIVSDIPDAIGYTPHIAPAGIQPVLQALNIHAITPNGIWGMPEQASLDRGKAVIDMLRESIHEQIAKLLELVNTHQ